jgi:hypothetical protein
VSGTDREKCPGCGRPLYSDRPSCLYCGYERLLEAREIIEMKKNLVSKGLGIQTSDAPAPAPGSGETPVQKPLFCPNCRKPLKPDSKFCSGCGSKTEEPAKSTPSAPEPAEKPKTIGTFTPKKAALPKPSEWRRHLNPSSLSRLIGFVVFSISNFLTFGAIQITETSSGANRTVPVDFPNILWIPALAIAVFIALSAVNLKFPGGSIYNKPFKFGFLFAVTIYNFAGLRQTFLNSWDLIVLYVLFLISLYAAGRMRKFFERFAPWSAAALLTSVYFFLITISLKSGLLSKTGWNPINNAGFYLLFISSILFLAGSYTNRGEAVESYPEESDNQQIMESLTKSAEDSK